MEDLFNNLLVSSDPYISSLRKAHDKKYFPLLISKEENKD